jgi:hypothetical protein
MCEKSSGKEKKKNRKYEDKMFANREDSHKKRVKAFGGVIVSGLTFSVISNRQ